MDLVHDGIGVSRSLDQWQFVFANLVCEMDLKPVETLLAKRLALCELKQTTVDVGTHVVEVRRNGIDTTSEVHVVREVDLVDALETHGNGQTQEELAPQSMSFSVLLMLLQEL